MDDAPVRVAVDSQRHVESARREARRLAGLAGLDATQAEEVVLATSELAANLVRYAHQGVIEMRLVAGARGRGIQIESCDQGPGIAHLDRAMEDGYSTGSGLGSGLPGARRLMDEFEITSSMAGTRVVARKWARPSR